MAREEVSLNQPRGFATYAGGLGVTIHKGTPTLTQVNVTASGGTVLAANANRQQALIYNAGAAQAYLGTALNLTTSNGFPLPAGAYFEDAGTLGAWCAICANGTVDLRIMEID